MKRFIQLLIFALLAYSCSAQSNSDNTAIQNVVNEMASAWKAGDGTQFASLFTEKHDFIIYSGYYSKDRDRKKNANHQQGLFNSMFKNTVVYFTVDKIEYLTDDVAFIHVLGAITPNGEKRPENPELLWTGILQKTGGSWKIKCLQLLDLELFGNDEMRSRIHESPKTMYASWYKAK